MKNLPLSRIGSKVEVIFLSLYHISINQTAHCYQNIIVILNQTVFRPINTPLLFNSNLYRGPICNKVEYGVKWIKTYKPYFITTLFREIAQQWLEQAEHIIRIVEYNQKRWDLRSKEDVDS